MWKQKCRICFLASANPSLSPSPNFLQISCLCARFLLQDLARFFGIRVAQFLGVMVQFARFFRIVFVVVIFVHAVYGNGGRIMCFLLFLFLYGPKKAVRCINSKQYALPYLKWYKYVYCARFCFAQFIYIYEFSAHFRRISIYFPIYLFNFLSIYLSIYRFGNIVLIYLT